MMPYFKQYFVIIFAVFLSACWKHSYPDLDKFVFPASGEEARSNIAQVFVDSNGTLYPSGWKTSENVKALKKRHSLLNSTAEGSEFRALIEQDEGRQLSQLAKSALNKKRVFILVHGYNNTVQEARPAYDLIEEKIALNDDDLVIRFYWDGLSASLLGGARIWFWAVGNSQLAGIRGLRKVLNQFSGKDVFLISHSRGASVILSAMANPVYDPKFKRDTLDVSSGWGNRYSNFLSQPPLENKGNNIRILFMAPAVDKIDFCHESQQPLESGSWECSKFKPLGDQVKYLGYTVNRKDRILNKFIKKGAYFNPTRLGIDENVGTELKDAYYPFFQDYIFETPSKDHGFLDYVRDGTFLDMLKDAGIVK